VKLDDLKGAEARYSKDLTLCRAKVEEFKISETKYESLCDETITTIKKREKQLIEHLHFKFVSVSQRSQIFTICAFELEQAIII
jgi:hypothetical protein